MTAKVDNACHAFGNINEHKEEALACFYKENIFTFNFTIFS